MFRCTGRRHAANAVAAAGRSDSAQAPSARHDAARDPPGAPRVSLSLWLALVGACLVISCTPGAGAINTMSNSLGSGWARSIWGILGQQLALLAHIAIVAAGVGALVSRSQLAFDAIRYV